MTIENTRHHSQREDGQLCFDIKTQSRDPPQLESPLAKRPEVSINNVKPPVRAFQYSSSVDKNFQGCYTVYKPSLTFVPINSSANNSRKGPTPGYPRVPSPSPSPPPIIKRSNKKSATIQSIKISGDDSDESVDRNEQTRKADESAFFNYMHIPSFSANIKIDRDYGDERNNLRGATKLSLPAFVYQCVTSINNKTLMFGGLRSAFGHENLKDLEGTSLDNIVIKFNYGLPSSLKASVLTNPFLFPDRTFYIVNSSTLSFTVHQIRGEAPPAILSLSSCVISKRHVFYFGGFEVITVDKYTDSETGKVIITKEIKMNEYGYILDTITLVCHKIKFNASHSDMVIPRIGHAIVGTVYDDKGKRKVESDSEADTTKDSPGYSPNATPVTPLSHSASYSTVTNATSSSSNSSNANSTFTNSNFTTSSTSTLSSRVTNQLYLNTNRLKPKSSFIATQSIYKRPNSPPVPITPTMGNFGTLGSPISKTESNNSEFTHSSGVSISHTESSHSSSIKHIMDNTNSASVLVFVFGGFKLNEETKIFEACNDLLKIELCINGKGTKKYYKFNKEALVSNLKPNEDDTDEEVVWPSPRGFMSSNIINSKLLNANGSPIVKPTTESNDSGHHKNNSNSTIVEDGMKSPIHPYHSIKNSSNNNNNNYYNVNQPQQPNVPPPPLPHSPAPSVQPFNFNPISYSLQSPKSTSPSPTPQFQQYQYQKPSKPVERGGRSNSNPYTFNSRFNTLSYKESALGVSRSAVDFLKHKAIVIQGGTDNTQIFPDLYWFEFESGKWFNIEAYTHVKSQETGKFLPEITPAGLFKFSHSLWQLDNYLLIFGGMGYKESGLQNANEEEVEDITYVSHKMEKTATSYNRLFVFNLENQTWFYPKYTHNLKQYITPNFFDNMKGVSELDSVFNVNLSTVNAGNIFDNSRIFSIGGEYMPFYTDEASIEGGSLAKDGKFNGNDLLFGAAMSIEIPILSTKKFQ